MAHPDIVTMQHVFTGAVLFFIAFLIWILISAARSGRLPVLYKRSFREVHRERLFLSAVGFFITFFIVRIITYWNHNKIGPFHDIYIGGVHIHHLVWGIALLLLVGYLWLWNLGRAGSVRPWVSRVMAIAYGVGSALTLDEFALWLNLKDVYWTEQGRESIRIALLFGGLLSMSLWGGPFLKAATREAIRIFRPDWHRHPAPGHAHPAAGNLDTQANAHSVRAGRTGHLTGVAEQVDGAHRRQAANRADSTRRRKVRPRG